jgi:DNA-binding NarL/FixJ family response regulator
LLKNAGAELLIEAVRAAASGNSLISPEVTRRLLDRVVAPGSSPAPGGSPLSDRETEVVRCVARGLTNAEAVPELHVSLSTVQAHLAAGMAKLEARNRVELVIWAYEQGLATG